jgi:hypothetical protein
MDRNSVIALFLLYRIVNVDVRGCTEFIQKLKKIGAFYTLFGELGDDADRGFNYVYFRMSVSSFDEMHRRLKESLQRRNSKMGNCIQPVEMLAVAIR